MKTKIAKIRIIINPASGKAQPILPVINAVMRDAGVRWDASITHGPRDARRFAEAATSEKLDALAIYGGDGTLREAIGGLLGSGTLVAVLPGGSANVMAAELGIPTDLHEACELLGGGSFEVAAMVVQDAGLYRGCYKGSQALGQELDW